LPEGHSEAHESSKATAEREAFKEAGVLGSTDAEPFGSFCYFKDSSIRRYGVTVHLLKLHSMANDFPERMTRKAKWFSLDEVLREASQRRRGYGRGVAGETDVRFAVRPCGRRNLGDVSIPTDNASSRRFPPSRLA
jgi:hypothetical protein